MQKFQSKRLMLPRALISGALIAALVATSADATILSASDGTVHVNRGKGFVSVSVGAGLQAGDRVRTRKGSATILYDNGCSVAVGPHQIVVVTSEPPCGAAAFGEPEFNPAIIGGLAAGAAALAVALANEDRGGSNEGGSNGPGSVGRGGVRTPVSP